MQSSKVQFKSVKSGAITIFGNFRVPISELQLRLDFCRAPLELSFIEIPFGSIISMHKEHTHKVRSPNLVQILNTPPYPQLMGAGAGALLLLDF